MRLDTDRLAAKKQKIEDAETILLLGQRIAELPAR